MTALISEDYIETVIDLSYCNSDKKLTHFMNRSHHWMGPGTCYTNTTPFARESSVLSTMQIVKWMREEGIPISAIADIMNVERKSIYAWINGSAIHEHNKERLEQVYSLLNENKMASLRNLYRFWYRKVLHEKSLSILFHETFLDKPSIRIALKKLWPLAQKEQDNGMKKTKLTTIKNNPILRDSREAVSEES